MLTSEKLEQLGRVDVLHLSPPCQLFSRSNRMADGGQEALNHEQAFLDVLRVIEHVKARIVTLEEVPGLLSGRHWHLFANLVEGLIRLGYSVRVDVLDLGKFGVPQTRDRIVLVAACPGQSLPAELHAYTKQACVGDFIPGTEKQRSDWPEVFANPTGTILTTHAFKWAWEAPMTWQEAAALQTFDKDFHFNGLCATAIFKCIGNAVPPEFAERLFKSCIDALRATDEAIAAVQG